MFAHAVLLFYGYLLLLLSPHSSAQLLRLTTLNLHNFAEPPLACYEWDNIYSHAQWQQKTQWLSHTLQRLMPDLLALQEVFSVAALAELLSNTGLPYWAASATPLLIDDHVFQKPVQVLASRYPITPLQWPELDPSQWPLGAQQFSFSRKPLLAEVELPELGKVRVVVCHLKSARPAEDLQSYPALAMWQSAQQRGMEAAILWQQLHQLYQQQPLPTMVMGDFNDCWTSTLLQPLHVAAKTSRGLFLLQDAADLALTAKRAPSHYYGADGRVLDYVLLSAEFDPRQHLGTAEVSAYQVHDQHLVRPNFEVDGYSSDHAAVVVDLNVRRIA